MTVSIVTICFNNLSELRATCLSVDQQTVPPLEHWIIDGSTSDDIRQFLKDEPQPVYRKWISERDEGISDAFNKGVMRSTGTLINMLNSADCYADEHVLETAISAFKKDADLQWLHSKYRLIRGGLWIEIGKPFEASKLYRGMRSLAHQSMFVKRGLHEKYGLYDKTLKIAMDYDFVCRIANEKHCFIRRALIIFAPGGTSTTNYLASLKENRAVFLRYGKDSLLLKLWLMRLRALHSLLTSPIGKSLYKLKVLLKLENA